MIPKAPGDKVKTDTRDCRRLARLHRAGELVAVRVPTPFEEAVRDLCRARSDMVEDLTRARNRLTKFLLRHSRVWRDGSNWTVKHEAWLSAQSFDEPAMQIDLRPLPGRGRYPVTPHSPRSKPTCRRWFDKEPFADPVRRLAAYRGVTTMGALCLQAEVCDWRRFGRAASFMGFVGLVPSEYSSGGSTHRGHITKAGNVHLRPSWSSRPGPTSTGLTSAPRSPSARRDSPPEVVARAWAAQLRLCGRFRHLAERKNTKSVVAAAVARELAGFLWAEMAA